MKNLKQNYWDTIVPKLTKEFDYKNKHEIPKIVKISVSCGLGLNASNRAFLQKATDEIRAITGQDPILTTAKNSIAGFKIREGMPLGLTVTLRREKMYGFLEKFIKLALPRIRDFRGLDPNNFDKYGNYNVGIPEQLVFPEIDYDQVEQRRGFNITIVTTAKTAQEGRFLLEACGLPFSKT